MEPEDLTPFCLDLFQQLKSRLPAEISTRLKSHPNVKRHGSSRMVYLFNVWDGNQKDLLKPNYFSYCLGYDPMHRYSPTTWYFHLWINTVRIYQYSDIIRSALVDIVQSQCPVHFKPEIDRRSVQAVIRSNFNGDLVDFVGEFLPLYEELIGTLHPYLTPIIDSFTYSLSQEEREAVIKSRQRFYCGPKRRMSLEEIRQYTRSVPQSWRAILLRNARERCVLCQVPIASDDFHADHIKPFSRGGLTVLENLQALCAPCNLSKGARE